MKRLTAFGVSSHCLAVTAHALTNFFPELLLLFGWSNNQLHFALSVSSCHAV